MAKLVVVLVLVATRASADGISLGVVGAVEGAHLYKAGGAVSSSGDVVDVGGSFALELGTFHGRDQLVGHFGFSFFTVDSGLPYSSSVLVGDAVAMYEHHWSALGIGGGVGLAGASDGNGTVLGFAVHTLASYDVAHLDEGFVSVRVDGELVEIHNSTVISAALGLAFRWD